jgi:hypothetical protein
MTRRMLEPNILRTLAYRVGVLIDDDGWLFSGRAKQSNKSICDPSFLVSVALLLQLGMKQHGWMANTIHA